MKAVRQLALLEQLKTIDAMVADPLTRPVKWQVGVVASDPESLNSRADLIVAGVEEAARLGQGSEYRASDNGRTLAGLLARLPRDLFIGYGPRILAIYKKAGDQHWLWKAESLLRRLGDLGLEALPYVLDRRALLPTVNAAGIEGLCRIGQPGKSSAEPTLLRMWRNSMEGSSRDVRAAIFVAMRRIGITPPPLSGDRFGEVGKFEAQWSSVTPRSPSDVCSWEGRTRISMTGNN